MAAPEGIRPADFEALIVLRSDKWKVAFRKTFIQLPVLLYKYLKWRYAGPGSGEFSDAYKAMLCTSRADCPDEPVTTEET